MAIVRCDLSSLRTTLPDAAPLVKAHESVPRQRRLSRVGVLPMTAQNRDYLP